MAAHKRQATDLTTNIDEEEIDDEDMAKIDEIAHVRSDDETHEETR